MCAQNTADLTTRAIANAPDAVRNQLRVAQATERTVRPRRQPGMRTRPALRADQLAELRAMLQQQREFRLDQLAALRRPNSHSALRGQHREITVALTVGAETALAEVLAALRRMDEGSYGTCAQCGGSIELERLEVLPQAARCLPCQTGAP